MLNKDKICAIVLLIIVIIIVILVLINIQICPKIDKPVVQFHEIKHKLKTGDVIAIHGCSLLKATIMRKYLGCKSTHVGMIVRKPSTYGLEDEIYVLELGPYGSFASIRNDVRMRSLDITLKESKHDTFALVPAPYEIELTPEDIKRYSTYKFNYFVPTMFAPYKKHKVCSSFVGMIHEEKGIGDANHHTLSPCDFYNKPETIFFKR